MGFGKYKFLYLVGLLLLVFSFSVTAIPITGFSPKHHLTGVAASYSSPFPNLWSVQGGVGWLMNLTSTYTGSTLGVDNNACLVFNDSSTMCSASSFNTSNFVRKDGDNMTGHLNMTGVNNITSLNCVIFVGGAKICSGTT